MRAVTSQLSAPGITPTQPARSESVICTPAWPLKMSKASSVRSTVRAMPSAVASSFRSETLGWLALRLLRPAAEKSVPRYSGATWMATGTGAASATAPKKRRYSISGKPRTGGGCRMTQAAPASAAARTKAIWPSTLASATVTASGRRPSRSSATHSSRVRRSTVESLFTSVARPNTPTPCTPWATTRSVCRRIAARSRSPSASNSA